MCTFTTVKFDSVDPSLPYYKVFKDEKCHYDEFYMEIIRDKTDYSKLQRIITDMGLWGEGQHLPDARCRRIKDVEEGYEFNRKGLHVYVLKVGEIIYIISGGRKTIRNSDIKTFKYIAKEFLKHLEK